VVQIAAGFVLINYLSLFLKYSKKQVVYFQLMGTFTILAQIVFTPLGTYLSYLIPTEFIILISGILACIAVIPLFFIRRLEHQEALPP